MAKPGDVIDDLLNDMLICPFPPDGVGKDRTSETATQNHYLNGVGTRVKVLRNIVVTQIINSLAREEAFRNDKEVVQRHNNNNFQVMNSIMRGMSFFSTKSLNTFTAAHAVGHVASMRFGLHIVVARDFCRLSNFSPRNRFLVARR